jgi:hypothetical protein
MLQVEWIGLSERYSPFAPVVEYGVDKRFNLSEQERGNLS